MNYRGAASKDIELIEMFLKKSSLPSNDINKYIQNFIVTEMRNKIIGIGGFEAYGEIGLIRSIAVAPEHRGNGIGERIYGLLEAEIRRVGITTLYLLTDTATEYFKKLGFVIRERQNVPEAIMQTKQFRELCPSSAIVMCNELYTNNV